MELYGVINMDIVGSRKSKDRQRLQNLILETIGIMNEKYAHILVAPIAITLGDEWQIFINKISEAYNVIHDFQRLFWKENIDVYAGIGIGQLSTSIHSDVRMMDGSCFHAARKAIQIVKNADDARKKYHIHKLNRVFFKSSAVELGLNSAYNQKGLHDLNEAMREVAAVRETNCPLSVSTIGDILENAINLIIENNEILKMKMTPKQRAVYINYMKAGSYRKIVSENHENNKKESIGGISQKLNNASYYTIQKNHQMVSALLGTYSGIGV